MMGIRRKKAGPAASEAETAEPTAPAKAEAPTPESRVRAAARELKTAINEARDAGLVVAFPVEKLDGIPISQTAKKR